MIELDKNKIYYISHPLTMDGPKGEYKHRIDEWDTSMWLQEFYPDCGFIRPLEIIPHQFNAKQAKEVWVKLLVMCDGIIMCGDWENSPGCKTEKQMAEGMGLEVIYHEDILL